MPLRLRDLDWAGALTGPFHPSPSSWADQTLYFLLLDRFSDGREDGYRDSAGAIVAGSTPMFGPGDEGNAVATEADAETWRDAGATWAGGTLDGARTKLGHLRRLGVTALWISPVLRQRTGTRDYHGYGIQNFLEVDPHFGTAADLKRLVREAHDAGMYVILDVVVNHTGDVFGYDADRYDTLDPKTGHRFTDPRWDGRPYRVAGWRDVTGTPTLPFPSVGPGPPGVGGVAGRAATRRGVHLPAAHLGLGPRPGVPGGGLLRPQGRVARVRRARRLPAVAGAAGLDPGVLI